MSTTTTNNTFKTPEFPENFNSINIREFVQEFLDMNNITTSLCVNINTRFANQKSWITSISLSGGYGCDKMNRRVEYTEDDDAWLIRLYNKAIEIQTHLEAINNRRNAHEQYKADVVNMKNKVIRLMNNTPSVADLDGLINSLGVSNTLLIEHPQEVAEMFDTVINVTKAAKLKFESKIEK